VICNPESLFSVTGLLVFLISLESTSSNRKRLPCFSLFFSFFFFFPHCSVKSRIFSPPLKLRTESTMSGTSRRHAERRCPGVRVTDPVHLVYQVQNNLKIFPSHFPLYAHTLHYSHSTYSYCAPYPILTHTRILTYVLVSMHVYVCV